MENYSDLNETNHEVKETDEPEIRVYMYKGTEVTIEGTLNITEFAKSIIYILDTYY